MDHPAIVLEDVPSIQQVDCDLFSKSIWITFNKTTDFIAVTDHWTSLVDDFVLITNHLGNCDSEFERGFFLADVDTMVITPTNMTVHLFAEPTDAISHGISMDVLFHDMPALEARHDLRRGLDFKENGLTIASNVSLAPGIALNDKNDTMYFIINAGHAQINSSVTYSGALKFSMLEMKVTEFWFDVKQSIYHDIGLAFDFKAPLVHDFAYKFPVASYYAVNIPGIIELGPELTLGIGVRFKVEEQVQVTTNFSSTITGGHAFIDFLDADKTRVDEWNPTYTATANISDSKNVTITPNVATTVRFACSLFNSVLDFSTGVTAVTGLPTRFGPTTTQAAVDSNNITLPHGGNCPSGFGFKKDFAVIIIAFATSWLKREYPVYEQPIDSGCIPWLSS
ncbi:hypothetical protein N0V82_003595 [Gnomoniopsis sp. IMI 355080]|nr:hypothetical protein N0V82_003595 [Gnomoniopsis sp. IMI 355080]